jgi:hypothetical protein
VPDSGDDHNDDTAYRFSFMGLGESEYTDTSERIEELLAAEWDRTTRADYEDLGEE